jgi:hypothetical protein
VNMLARLYNAPKDGKPTGTSCVGSSEGASPSLFEFLFPCVMVPDR